jgi:hypothetical protein
MRERITSLEAALTDEHIANIKSARTFCGMSGQSSVALSMMTD